MSSRCITQVFKKYCKDDYLGHTSEKFMVRIQNFQSKLFGYTETFKTVSLKNFMNWLLLQTKILFLRLGIRKDVAVLLNKKSMNQISSRNVFLRF